MAFKNNLRITYFVHLKTKKHIKFATKLIQIVLLGS